MATLHPRLSEAFALSAAGQHDQAVAMIAALAEAGEPEALFTLADIHWRGIFVPADPPRARALFRRAGEAGHPMGLRAYTNMLANGAGGPRDWQGALRRLAAEARDDGRRALMLETIGRMDLTAEGDPRVPPRPRPVTESPHIVQFPNLFSPAECAFLTIVAEPSYEPAKVGYDTAAPELDPNRTAEAANLHWLIEDPAIHALNRRLAAASGTHAEQGEPMQIIRYRPGQEYKRHLDWQPGNNNPRVLTALVYLNEEYSGGETEFDCAAIRIRGHAGDCIVFRNAGADGRADPMSRHAGLPVLTGTKLLASRWIRARRFTP